MAEEATVNPDGSTTFEPPPPETDGAEEGAGFDEGESPFEEETLKAAVEEGIDPAIYLLAGAVVLAFLYFVFVYRKKEDEDDFFAELDVEKVRSRWLSLLHTSGMLLWISHVLMSTTDCNSCLYA